MTSATLAQPYPTRLRLTVRGRRVLAALAAVPAVIAIAFAVVGGGSALATGVGEPPASFTYVTVAPGESLWSIAQEIAPAADPRDVVAELARLNAIDDGVVSAGAQLAIPAQYAD